MQYSRYPTINKLNPHSNMILLSWIILLNVWAASRRAKYVSRIEGISGTTCEND
jgi:hypothetical protein